MKKLNFIIFLLISQVAFSQQVSKTFQKAMENGKTHYSERNIFGCDGEKGYKYTYSTFYLIAKSKEKAAKFEYLLSKDSDLLYHVATQYDFNRDKSWYTIFFIPIEEKEKMIERFLEQDILKLSEGCVPWRFYDFSQKYGDKITIAGHSYYRDRFAAMPIAPLLLKYKEHKDLIEKHVYKHLKKIGVKKSRFILQDFEKVFPNSQYINSIEENERIAKFNAAKNCSDWIYLGSEYPDYKEFCHENAYREAINIPSSHEKFFYLLYGYLDSDNDLPNRDKIKEKFRKNIQNLTHETFGYIEYYDKIIRFFPEEKEFLLLIGQDRLTKSLRERGIRKFKSRVRDYKSAGYKIFIPYMEKLISESTRNISYSNDSQSNIKIKEGEWEDWIEGTGTRKKKFEVYCNGNYHSQGTFYYDSKKDYPYSTGVTFFDETFKNLEEAKRSVKQSVLCD